MNCEYIVAGQCHAQSTFISIIRLNTNTLFGLLFGLNRIRIEYLVQAT